jgi:hypothetical protein
MIRLRIGTGLDALNFKKFSHGHRHFTRSLIKRINGLVPDRYQPPGVLSPAIERAIARAVTYVNDTCPPALRRVKIPQNCAFRERCRIVAGLIPITYFPPSGEVTDRFFQGLIRYLEDVQANNYSINPPSLPAQSNVLRSPITTQQARHVSGISGRTNSSSSNPGSNETSAIKIEDSDEGQSVPSSSRKRKRRTEAYENATTRQTKPPPRAKQDAPVIPNPIVEVTERRPDVHGITEQLRHGLEVSPAIGRLPESSIHETTDEESETESETSSEEESEYEDVRPSVESASVEVTPRTHKPKKSPLNVYRAMYEEATVEIQFLQDL